MGKVEVIPGDLAQPQCGISAENQRRLLPEVQYVIHAAASIQFDNPIHTDLTLSYVATKTIADFAAKVHIPASFLCVWNAHGKLPVKCDLQDPAPELQSGLHACYVLTWLALRVTWLCGVVHVVCGTWYACKYAMVCGVCYVDVISAVWYVLCMQACAHYASRYPCPNCA